MYKLGAAYAGGSRILDVICEGRTFGMLARVECFVSSCGTSNIYALSATHIMCLVHLEQNL
jgi:hypothetical protein